MGKGERLPFQVIDFAILPAQRLFSGKTVLLLDTMRSQTNQ